METLGNLESITEKELSPEKALAIVQEEHDIFALKVRLSKGGLNFDHLTNVLNLGVERKLYTADERDRVLKQNKDVLCMYAFSMVKNGSPHRLWKHILYDGIKSALFSREEVSKATTDGVKAQYIAQCGGKLDDVDIAVGRFFGFL